MNTESTDPADGPPSYGDPHRVIGPDGCDAQLRADAPIPGWVESFGRYMERAIFGGLMHQQHEYLEHRRLPHTVRTWEIKTTPWLLKDGYILALTDFPIATETCCVVAFTPVYTDGRTAMDRSASDEAMELNVIDFEIFVYQERGRTAFENARMILHPHYVAELKRQAFALKLQYIQFFYFTQLVPKVREAFEDPHGHLEAFLNRMRQTVSQRRAASPPSSANNDDSTGGPTFIDQDST
jgi:hypothetical protein